MENGDRALGARRPTLASDADRDAVARTLGAAFAEGRLDADEHGERVRAAYAGRTWQDLELLIADLPGPVSQSAVAAPGGLDVWTLEKCLICALLIACPPVGIVWLLIAIKQSRSAQRQPGPGGMRAEDH